jgi:predicted nucleic-acid-binding Zn-ribbon protein
MHNVSTGIIFSPDHGQRTIPKSIRVYSSNSCKNCDPVAYILESRLSTTDSWTEVGAGALPWTNENVLWSDLLRNDQGLQINSTYESGDENLYYTEVHFHGHSEEFLEYKVTFAQTRNPTQTGVSLAELEITGMLMPPDPTTSPTLSPSLSPTKSPTQSPSMSPSNNPTAELPADGTLVANILAGDTFTNFGCVNVGAPWKSSDGSTNKYYCDRTGMHNFTTGIIATSTTGQQTIPKELRVYAANGCKNCDPEFYTLEGRATATSDWVEVASGYLPWAFTPRSEWLRNDQGLTVNSSYSSGDPILSYTNVHFHGHSEPYLDYKMTFATRNEDTGNTFQFGEIEIAGMILP